MLSEHFCCHTSVLMIRKKRNCGKFASNYAARCIAKPAPEDFPVLSMEMIQFSQLCAVEPGKVCLQPSVFPLHPQLFQVKRQRKEEQLNTHVRLAARQE